MGDERDERDERDGQHEPAASGAADVPAAAREVWTLVLFTGALIEQRWTPDEALRFARDPGRHIVIHDAAGQVREIVLAAAIAAIVRGRPSQIAVPDPGGNGRIKLA